MKPDFALNDAVMEFTVKLFPDWLKLWASQDLTNNWHATAAKI